MVSSCSESEGTHGEGDKKQSKSFPEAVNQRADLLSGFDLSRDFQTCLYYARGAGYRADKASHLFVSQVARGAQKKTLFLSSTELCTQSDRINVSFMKL
jgi:hypothetical protein